MRMSGWLINNRCGVYSTMALMHDLLNYSFNYWLLNETFKWDTFHVSILSLFIQVQLKSVSKTADGYQLAAFYWHMQYLEKEERRFGKYPES